MYAIVLQELSRSHSRVDCTKAERGMREDVVGLLVFLSCTNQLVCYVPLRGPSPCPPTFHLVTSLSRRP